MSESNPDKIPETPADTTTRDGVGLASDALLAPCPFCGSPTDEDAGEYPPVTVDKNDEYADVTTAMLNPYSVQCCYCLSQGPTADTIEDAEKFWNKRANVLADTQPQ